MVFGARIESSQKWTGSGRRSAAVQLQLTLWQTRFEGDDLELLHLYIATNS